MFDDLNDDQLLMLYKITLIKLSDITREKPLDYVKRLKRINKDLKFIIQETKERGLIYGTK